MALPSTELMSKKQKSLVSVVTGVVLSILFLAGVEALSGEVEQVEIGSELELITETAGNDSTDLAIARRFNLCMEVGFRSAADCRSAVAEPSGSEMQNDQEEATQLFSNGKVRL